MRNGTDGGYWAAWLVDIFLEKVAKYLVKADYSGQEI